MYKKTFLAIAILTSYSTKIHSINRFTYTWNNSCIPTTILTTLISAGILIKEKDADLIFPLAGMVALSTAVSGITSLSSIFTSKKILEWNCNNDCGSNCTQHICEDSIKYTCFNSLYKHSYRVGALAGLFSAGGCLLYHYNR